MHELQLTWVHASEGCDRHRKLQALPSKEGMLEALRCMQTMNRGRQRAQQCADDP